MRCESVYPNGTRKYIYTISDESRITGAGRVRFATRSEHRRSVWKHLEIFPISF